LSCPDNTQQFGQGREVGSGAWVSVSAPKARSDAYKAGATGYYRPEDLELTENLKEKGRGSAGIIRKRKWGKVSANWCAQLIVYR